MEPSWLLQEKENEMKNKVRRRLGHHFKAQLWDFKRKINPFEWNESSSPTSREWVLLREEEQSVSESCDNV